MWLRCAVTFLFAFIFDLHEVKMLTMLYCAAFGCKHDSARYRELSFSISSGKTDSSEATNSQLRASFWEVHAIC